MSNKRALRTQVITSRKRRTGPERELSRAGIRTAVLSWCAQARLAEGSRIAAYEPLPSEPGSVELLADLHRAGYQVIVPITLQDRDLDWVRWLPSGEGSAEPLGLPAISSASLVLVPAFAVDAAGRRLGRGGGSYDRALLRVAPPTPTAALLFEDEIVERVPVDEWDVPVTAVVTPSGWRDLGGCDTHGAS